MDSNNAENCYCVCHSLLSSRAFCEHCRGDNNVYRAKFTVGGQDVRESTKRSIALLVAERRGDDKPDDKDLITASNILFVCSRFITEEKRKYAAMKLTGLYALKQNEIHEEIGQELAELTQSDSMRMQCTDCGKLTTSVEAETRNFNTGKCGYCGGELKNYLNNKAEDEELREKINRIVYVIGARKYAGIPSYAPYVSDDGTKYLSIADYIMQLITAEKATDEEYLLECFNAVARYAQSPEELGGMKPETALMNYKNHCNRTATGEEHE